MLKKTEKRNVLLQAKKDKKAGTAKTTKAPKAAKKVKGKKIKKVKKIKKTVSSKKTIKKTEGAKGSYKRGTLSASINQLFKTRGVDKVTFEEAVKVAKAALPSTPFNKAHFSWYKNKFRNDFDV